MTGKRRRPSAWQQWKAEHVGRRPPVAGSGGRDATRPRPAVSARDDTEVLAPVSSRDDTEVISPVPLRDPERRKVPRVREVATHHEIPFRDQTESLDRVPEPAASVGTERGSEPSMAHEKNFRPLYARALFLQNIDPGPVLCFFFFEVAVALGITLAFAEMIPWPAVPVLPVTVAAMVKLNDLVAGSAKRKATWAPAAPEPVWERTHADPVKDAHLAWRRGLPPDLTSTQFPRARSRDSRDVYPYDSRSRELPQDW